MIMSISGKVSDMFGLRCGDVDYDGYVPSGLCIGGGDYVDIKIDITTGQIQNWKPLTEADVKAACFGEEENEEEYEED